MKNNHNLACSLVTALCNQPEACTSDLGDGSYVTCMVSLMVYLYCLFLVCSDWFRFSTSKCGQSTDRLVEVSQQV